MPALPGYVYHDAQFKLSETVTKPKFFVVLCDSTIGDGCLLVAVTTSKEKCPEVLGCYPDVAPPCFFLPETHAPKPMGGSTTVLFDELFLFESAVLDRWSRIGSVSVETHVAMLRCGAESEYISGYDRQALLAEALLLQK